MFAHQGFYCWKMKLIRKNFDKTEVSGIFRYSKFKNEVRKYRAWRSVGTSEEYYICNLKMNQYSRIIRLYKSKFYRGMRWNIGQILLTHTHQVVQFLIFIAARNWMDFDSLVSIRMISNFGPDSDLSEKTNWF